MAVVVPDILARIVDHKRTELRKTTPQQRAEWERKAGTRTDVRNFKAALTAHHPAIISEIKKASPSKGVLSQMRFC
jgi:indole-3-glycerol phosphate synthase